MQDGEPEINCSGKRVYETKFTDKDKGRSTCRYIDKSNGRCDSCTNDKSKGKGRSGRIVITVEIMYMKAGEKINVAVSVKIEIKELL